MRPACLPLVAALMTVNAAAAQAIDAAAPAIYQQRNADGSIVLTDRPSAGAVTQRSWRVEPDDPGAAARRESARREAAEVTRRIGQKLDADDRRAQDLALARLRADGQPARVDADAADLQPTWLVAPRVGAFGRGPRNPAAEQQPFVTGRPPTAAIVRGIPLRADGFPIR